MLQKYLDRFNNEPYGPLLPANNSRFFKTLISIGALFPAKRAVRSQCKVCGAEELRHAWTYDDQSLTCLKCGGKVELWQPLAAARVRDEWLPTQLSAQLAGAEPVCLISNRLWRLATVPIGQKNVSVYLFRYIWTDEVAQTIAALDADAAERQVLLTTKRIVPAELSGKGRMTIPLVKVARIDREGLVTSVEQLESAIASLDPSPEKPSNAGRWFDLSEDGSLLRLHGEELSLQRKQRAFVLAIAEAHDAGQARPRQGWVLRRAGYSNKNTSLSQICSRKEFARFIDWRNGEVAIRRHLLPPKDQQGREEG